jgi:hypothetical protein
MIDKLFIEGVNYYQFAAVVEDEILTQAFPALDGRTVALSSRRTFTPSETANRLEIEGGGDFVHPITLDCRLLSNGRLMVTRPAATIPTNPSSKGSLITSGCSGASHSRTLLLAHPRYRRQGPFQSRTGPRLLSLPGKRIVRMKRSAPWWRTCAITRQIR